MNHRERIHAALRGQPTDHTPVALWQHFPGDDLEPAKFAARVVAFQRAYDFDFVKVTPASSYPAEMYGAAFRALPPDAPRYREGVRECIARPVTALSDWDRITPLTADNFVCVREVAALKLIRAQLGPAVPILQTIFSPLNAALNIAGERLYADLREQPAIVHRALDAITATTATFAAASLRAGADAIFFATQMATAERLTLDEFRAFGVPYDLQVLAAIQAAHADFVFLHVHGLNIYFAEASQYPVQIVNWHDRRTPPTLRQAQAQLPGKAIAGGINEWETLAAQTRAAVSAEARDALAQTDGRGFILASGCVIPTDTPPENIRAVLEVARG